MSKLNNRPTVRNLIKTGSQTSSQIDHKCRLSFIATDVFSLPDAVVDVDQRCCGFRPTLPHTLSLSLCLSVILLSPPFFPFDIKTLATTSSSSIEIQISPYLLVLISKVTSIQKYVCRLKVCRLNVCRLNISKLNVCRLNIFKLNVCKQNLYCVHNTLNKDTQHNDIQHNDFNIKTFRIAIKMRHST
jgi:hypothetical protein